MGKKKIHRQRNYLECYAEESSRVRDAEVVEESKPTIVRQLFVTISPDLCYTVKRQVSHLTSNIAINRTETIDLDAADLTSSFKDIPNTFVDTPPHIYPLVITFDKFLMMLDGTLKDSFFGRFHEARLSSHGSQYSRSVETLNVTFERFRSLYWPHFNSKLKKKLDPSTVYVEIISRIKAGLQAGETPDGRLSYEAYSSLSERACTLTKPNREIVYHIFQAYEKLKTERGEYDLADLVNDLHRRFKSGNYEGDRMNFIYINEVQDLSMRQISLFKYICQNNDDGFAFAGDTTQAIASGMHFRFQDISTLFYDEFLANKTTENQEKGFVSEIFQLKHNFRTHVGILKLAQSVVDILYHYFSQSIDILEPETSSISGEPPMLLESGDDKNLILTIFGGSGSGGEIVGFGAEQVILVRDDCAKTEICKYVGKHALVLTIAECQCLQFQDVLLYKFFGKSHLKGKWRVIYAYMKERDLLDEKFCHSFPNFSEARHNVLCSELKQLYVAITRTRQRLWICENKEELSQPMFDYWKRRGLVQERRKLDDLVARTMWVASSPKEWLQRGIKLFNENNFRMATLCFGRADDKTWEKLAKASGLRADAEQMQETNSQSAAGYLREAAEMFESIGKLELAASCYSDSGEFEKSGKIYLDKCGQTNAAAESFARAGCYSDAAEAYAKGGEFSKCLSICRKGELFDRGLQYIEYWEEHAANEDLGRIKQEFLESCAHDHHKRKDAISMMKFVRAFGSMESKRVFLRSSGCIDDLMLLEEELGNFLEAAMLVESRGDVLKEADLLVKAGKLVDATLLILWYVLYGSLWENRNKGWPLKQFARKKQLCKKATSLAKMESEIFYGFVVSEVKVLSHEASTLSELRKHLQASQEHKSLRGEILSIRKILDAHLHVKSTMYEWEEELPIDTNKHSEAMIVQNKVSVRTLVFYWNMWKENVVGILESLGSIDNEEAKGHMEFSFNYFGVRTECVNGNMVYLLINKDANWIKKAGHMDLCRDGNRVTCVGRQLAVAIQSYWQMELLSVGIKVLETLQGLHKSVSEGSAFHQSTRLLHIFEVSKFFLDSRHLSLTSHQRKTLKSFLKISTTYVDIVFPLDWRRCVVSDAFISLKESDLSFELLEEIMLQDINREGDLTYKTMGRVIMICVASRKPTGLYEKIITGIQWNPFWKSFVEKFWSCGFDDIHVAAALRDALVDAYVPKERSSRGYISAHTFMNLLEAFMFMASYSSGSFQSKALFFTTKSYFLGWFVRTSTPSRNLSSFTQMFSKDGMRPIVGIIKETLRSHEETISWIRGSNMSVSYHPVLVLKLIMMLSLICMQAPVWSRELDLLLFGKKNIAHMLPEKFVSVLSSKKKNDGNLKLNPEIVAKAFVQIEDPLLIVKMDNTSLRIFAPSAMFVDLRTPREEMMKLLFQSNVDAGEASDANQAQAAT